MSDHEKEEQEIGNDLEQIVAMLERSEIDYYQDEDGDEDEQVTIVDINDSVRMVFDEEGELLSVSPLPF